MLNQTLRWSLAILAGFLMTTAVEGPDFGSYTDWAAAALSGDIFTLRGNVLSPMGVPFTIAAAGPGLLFAIGKAAMRPLTLVSASLVTGWVAAIVFWSCSLSVLRRMADGRDGLALFGAGVLFVGTHAGLYSHSYATEVLANALIAALWAIAVTREGEGQRWRWLDSAIVGALAGLLLLVRAHVVVYAIPALWLAVSGRVSDGPHGRQLTRLVATAVPFGIAITEYVTINRWMTGSWIHPPYVYGAGGFSSVDLAHPEFAAALLHPWHGLLAYHPLYGVAFAAVLIEAWRSSRWPRVRQHYRAIWIVTLAAAVFHVWVQAGWYIWWLGGTTFGMRGLAPAALPLVAGLVAGLRHDCDTAPRRAALWICAAVLACAWSYPLLLRGNTQFHSWTALLTAQTPAVIAVAILSVIFGVALIARRRFDAGTIELTAYRLFLVLSAATVVYLVYQVTLFPELAVRAIAGFVAAGLVASLLFLPGVRARHLHVVAGGVALTVFVLQVGLFARLALRTERHVASGAPPPRPFAYVSASPVDELRVTYAEYLEVPGFDRQKAAFRRFLQAQRIDASRLSPEDRRIAEAVLQALVRDPLLSGVLVEPIARDGAVQMAAATLTDAQQSRARELALSVPGAKSVTFLP